MSALKLFAQSLRMVRAYRLYSIVNIVGLALGLACTIVITKYIHRELTVDRFHPAADRLYCAVYQRQTTGKSTMTGFPTAFYGQDPATIEKAPEVEVATHVVPMPDEELEADGRKFSVRVLAADSNFYKVLGFPLRVGDPASVLRDPNNAVLTQETARKLFGNEDPLGRSLTVCGHPVTVAGIAGEPPGKSTLQYDVIVSDYLQGVWKGGTAGIHYCRLVEGACADTVNSRYGTYKKEIESQTGGVRYQFFPLTQLYMGPVDHYSDGMQLRGNMQSVYILGIVALVVLLIGVFNFINIYTVVLQRRGKELGVKKVFGVGSRTILGQFVGENVIMALTAVVLALLVVAVASGPVRAAFGIDVVPDPGFDVLLSLGLAVAVPALTVVYPYLKYRFSSPIKSLKDVKSGKGGGTGRSAFIVVQYAMSVTLIVVAVYFARQFTYMVDRDPGYTANHVVEAMLLPAFNPNNAGDRKAYFKDREKKAALVQNELEREPLVSGWTTCEAPVQWGDWKVGFRKQGSSDGFEKTVAVYANGGAQGVYGFSSVAGRWLADSLDGTEHYKTYMGIVINETAQRMLGVGGPGEFIECEESILHTSFQDEQGKWHSEGDSRLYKVVGIVRDFSFQHLTRQISPLVMLSSEEELGLYGDEMLSIRYPEGREREIVSVLEDIYHKVNPGGDLKYCFVKDRIRAMYEEDHRAAVVYSTFALVAILISSMGLFSLSVYDVQQRYREIALRKVHGSTVGEVMRLLTWKYYRLLLVSGAVSIPLAWYVIRVYTREFAVRAPLSWWIFALAALATAAITLLTLWWQTYRAATENPARAMKAE